MPAPLTGRLVTADVAARRPIAVMIDDLRAARPQSGFSAASVVWQAPAEGGIPRYMLIFQDQQPGSVGPVRSARYYYIAWAAEWHAVYAHVGGSPQAMSTLAAQGQGQLVYNADEFRWGGIFFHRIKERAAPHNAYTDGDLLRKMAARIGAKDELQPAAWQFAPDAPPGRPAVRRADPRGLSGEHDHLSLRPADQHLPALGHRRDRPRPMPPRASASRRATWSSC